jgi:TRAP-type C4-dicarboxylate transport system permease small subunit
MVLIGSSAAYRYQQHPALGIVTKKFKKSFRRIWEIIIDLILLSIHFVVFLEGFQMAQRELIARTPALRISFFWVYLALPIGAFLISLQIVLKHIFGLKTMNNHSDEPTGSQEVKQ